LTAPDEAAPVSSAGREIPIPARGALLAGFLKIGLLGFGGVMPLARRVLVDERGWLTNQAFAELIGMCQVLPGPNVVNLAVIIGARYHGPLGALLALTGILFVPTIVVLLIAAFYASVAHEPAARLAVGAASAAAAGLILGTALRLAIHSRFVSRSIAIATLAFVGVAIMHWPLFWVIAVLIPVAIFLEWRAAR
jgi:chromate transporter